MSKKRVHEIAKELKDQGIELDNKEVVTELVSLGYDVKSHSSSLEDDQAAAALKQIIKKYQGKQGISRAGAPRGFVVQKPVRPAPGAAAPTAGKVQVAASAMPPPSDQRLHVPQKGDKTALPSAKPQTVGSRAERSNAPLPKGGFQPRPSASTGRQPSHLLVDASNICLFFGDARLVLLRHAVQRLRTLFPSAEQRVIVDASLRHRFKKGSEDWRDLEAKIRNREWEQVAAGQQADKLLFMYMRKYPDAWVVSNDQFKDAVEAGTSRLDLVQRHLRFHVDPTDLEFLLLEA